MRECWQREGNLQETGAGRCLVSPKEGGKACALGAPVAFTGMLPDWDCECADENLACQTGHFFVGSTADGSDDGIITTPVAAW
jgi:hypothetical protein